MTSTTTSRIRPLKVEQSVLVGSDGSCRFNFGKTCVLVAINGPIEAKTKNEDPFKANLEIIVQPLCGSGSISERYLESFLRETASHVIDLSAYPRTNILVTIQVICDDGSLLAACWNGLMFAALDACLPVLSMVWAVSVTSNEEGALIIDPSFDDCSSNGLTINNTVTFVSDGENSVIGAMGLLESIEMLEEALIQAKNAIKAIRSFAESSIISKLNRDFSQV